ncbi:MAG: AAA family ATPase [Ktedonobacteraceae bacterium]
MTTTVPILFITGPVGVGKTSVAGEISEQLDKAGVAHAFVDIDSLRWCYPRPPHDRFHTELGMKNLAVVWRNFQVAGAACLVLVDVLESRDVLERYRAAIPGAEFLVVRLRAEPHTLASRVQARELGSGLEWHLQRTAELATQMDRSQVEDLLVDTEGKSITAIAREILERSKWHGIFPQSMDRFEREE